jgi:hypothetical protein
MVFSGYRAGTAISCESAFDLPPVGRYLSAHGSTVLNHDLQYRRIRPNAGGVISTRRRIFSRLSSYHCSYASLPQITPCPHHSNYHWLSPSPVPLRPDQSNHPVVLGAVHRTLTLFNSRALFGSYSRLNDATDALDSGLVFIRIVLRIVIQLLASQTRAGREGLVGFDCPYEICLS